HADVEPLASRPPEQLADVLDARVVEVIRRVSGKTPSWLLFFFWPVESAAMAGDESVMSALSADVITMPVTSRVSIDKCPSALPSRTPFDTILAAVRWAAPIPSPSNRVILRARGELPPPAQPSTVSCTLARAPSAVFASIVSGPARFTL